MAIKYFPKDLLKSIAPAKKIERLVTQKLTLNRLALSTLSDVSFLKKKDLREIVLKVIQEYRERYGDERAAGASKAQALGDTLNDKALMVQRVQNATAFQVAKKIKKTYRGDRYRWLPSDADEPDPLHQLNYGQIFRIGVGEMPGDRYGCRCGMEILTDETELEFLEE